MKTVWIASAALMCAPVLAQTTIYKLVDDSGHVTYSNKPMKGATVVELDPITTIPTPPEVALVRASLGVSRPADTASSNMESKSAVATLTPLPTSLAAVDLQTQKRRDDTRRHILEDELQKEQESLDIARTSLTREQQNPELVAAVKLAQNADNPTPAQQVAFRVGIDKVSGRIRGLQATVSEHEKNIEALRKELGALKP